MSNELTIMPHTHSHNHGFELWPSLAKEKIAMNFSDIVLYILTQYFDWNDSNCAQKFATVAIQIWLV